MTSRKFNIIIVGAGIAGLATAIALAETGNKVVILEAAPKLSAVGAGIQLPPNSLGVLKRLGVYDKIAKLSDRPTSIVLKRWQDGSVIAQTPLGSDFERRYGAPYLMIHRADLLQVLLDRAYAVGVEIKLDTYVSIINQADPSITLSNGDKLGADLVVGADGLKSHVRKAVLEGQDVEIRFNPSCVYRTLIPRASLRDELQPLIDAPLAQYWLGPKAHVIGYPISNGAMYNLVLCDSSTPPVGLIPKVVPLAELQSRFREWDPVVREMIDLVPEPLKWQLSEIEQQRTWVSKSGKVVVIGDASHAMVPHLAQGAAMALEDAVALAVCLDRATNSKDIPAFMDHFQQLRRPRCHDIQREAREVGTTWHHPDGAEQESRDQRMRDRSCTIEKQNGEMLDNPNRWDDHKYGPLLFGYNAYDEACTYLDLHYPATTSS